MGYFRFFFHRTDIFLPCTLSYKLKKIVYKKSFKILFIKIYNANTKKRQGEPNAPPKPVQGFRVTPATPSRGLTEYMNSQLASLFEICLHYIPFKNDNFILERSPHFAGNSNTKYSRSKTTIFLKLFPPFLIFTT